jgi:beta-lactamase class A
VNSPKTLLIIGCIALFALGWGGAVTWERHHQPMVSIIRENSANYHFINPVLIIDNSEVAFAELDPLKESIESLIQKEEAVGRAKQVSVYFRDFTNSHWTGVEEDESYAPSSMIKLVTLLAYLKLAQDDPDLLQQKIYFENKADPGQHYKPMVWKAGNYSIRELLSHMIVDSDNDSMTLLNKLHPGKFLEVYEDLGLPKPFSDSDDFMSAELYSRLFRALYGSTLLTRQYSEEALKLLSQTTYDKGLVAGVPAGTSVAHKFGEHTVLDPQGSPVERQLHDCGIVYYPGHPYFLCVMTKGLDFAELEHVVSGISALVYAEVGKD